MATVVDENTNVNIRTDSSGDAVKRDTASGSPTGSIKEEVGPKLEPSMSAWAASRPVSSMTIRNIGASERGSRPGDLSVAELSVCSKYTRTSQRSTCSRRSLSSEQLADIEIRRKRNELKANLKRNEKNYKAAIYQPDALPVAQTARSLDITVPEEFNLSTSSRVRSSSRESSRGRRHAQSDQEHWSNSLRKSGARSKSRGRSWAPQLTVPKSPRLCTGSRTRSRSASSSRYGTPASTPERHAMSTTNVLPLREIMAVEEHNVRMTLARNPLTSTPRRKPSESPMRRRLNMGSCEPSPARSCSVQSCSDMSLASVRSRLSHLSRPRSLSRPHLSSESLQLREAQQGRHQVQAQIQSNARTLQRVLSEPQPPRPSPAKLTVPMEPELQTHRRARSRSVSVHSARSVPDRGCMLERLLPRERAAVNRHLERTATAQMLDKASSRPAPAASRETQEGPCGERQAQWIREATTAEGRARRARAVAQAMRSEMEKNQVSRLCIFSNAKGFEDEPDVVGSPSIGSHEAGNESTCASGLQKGTDADADRKSDSGHVAASPDASKESGVKAAELAASTTEGVSGSVNDSGYRENSSPQVDAASVVENVADSRRMAEENKRPALNGIEARSSQDDCSPEQEVPKALQEEQNTDETEARQLQTKTRQPVKDDGIEVGIVNIPSAAPEQEIPALLPCEEGEIDDAKVAVAVLSDGRDGEGDDAGEPGSVSTLKADREAENPPLRQNTDETEARKLQTETRQPVKDDGIEVEIANIPSAAPEQEMTAPLPCEEVKIDDARVAGAELSDSKDGEGDDVGEPESVITPKADSEAENPPLRPEDCDSDMLIELDSPTASSPRP